MRKLGKKFCSVISSTYFSKPENRRDFTNAPNKTLKSEASFER